MPHPIPNTPKTGTRDLPPTPSPPRARTHKKGQTRFEKETAATGGKSAADHPGDPKIIGPWRIGKTIGKGASGRVKIAKHNRNGQFAAVKIIPKHALLMASRNSIKDAAGKQEKAILGIEREIVIMKLVDHPNVLCLYDVWETSKELYLVLEYVEGGELFDYLVSQGRLHADEASRYFQQIIAGVDYCHRFNICHRDLKPENLLLDSEGNIKIADFGMAALEPSGRLLETSCGSPHYASPEIVMGVSYHGAASDIWSCGVILFALLTGRLPFDDENIRVLLQKVKNGRFSIPSDLPPDARDLIARMLVVDPTKRITMPDIMIHPFFQRRQSTDSGRIVRSVDPPKLEEVARPVKSESEIDKDILRNLRTLWSGCSEEKMIRALLTHEKNMEKAFYFLLLQYRNKNLENYNGEIESPRLDSHPLIQQAINLPSADVRRHSTTGAIERRRVKDKDGSYHTGRGDRKVTSRRGSVSAVVPNHVRKSNRDKENITPKTVSRPAPPAPGKSPMTPARVIGPRPPSRGTSPAASPHPDGPKKSTIRLVQQREAESDSPRTPPHPGAQTANLTSPTPATYAVNPHLPKILVQIPTPQNDTPVAAGLGLNMPVHHQQPATPSPAPASERAAVMAGMTGSPPLGSISVPKVQDAALQKFFHDIAEQLQLIGSASPRSSIAIETPAPTPTLVQDEIMASPIQVGRESEDVEMDGSTAPVSSPPAPLVTRPLPNRAQTDLPPTVTRQDPIRRRSYLGDASDRDNIRPIENIPTPVRKVSQKERKVSGKSMTSATGQMKRKSKPAPLDLSPNAMVPDQLLSPTGSPYLGTPPLSGSQPGSPLIVGPSQDAKHSWFSNLFSWKPAMFTLISADDCASSRSECIRLLESFGASVVVEDADGWGILKCRVDEIRGMLSHSPLLYQADESDISGIIVSKQVRFRIEFLPHSAWTTATPRSPRIERQGSYTGSSGPPVSPRSTLNTGRRDSHQQVTTSTSMTMVQERGALSSFRAVYGRLRAEWRLDSLKSPALGGGSAAGSRFASPMPSPVMGQEAQMVWG